MWSTEPGRWSCLPGFDLYLVLPVLLWDDPPSVQRGGEFVREGPCVYPTLGSGQLGQGLGPEVEIGVMVPPLSVAPTVCQEAQQLGWRGIMETSQHGEGVGKMLWPNASLPSRDTLMGL